MASFVITWKPTGWPYDQLIESVREHSVSKPAKINWRFRAYRQGKVGDAVFLLKQGPSPRGIFGFGAIAEDPRHSLGEDDNDGLGPLALIEFELFVDPNERMLVGEDQAKTLLPLQVLNSRFSGVTISDQTGAALRAAIVQNRLAAGGAFGIPTDEAFATALSRMHSSERLSQDERDMLVCHYNAPQQKLTARMMSALMGWRGQRANSPYGALGRKLSEEMNWIPKERAGIEGFYVAALVMGDDSSGEFVWTMRAQVSRALERLDWPGLRISDANLGEENGSVIERGSYSWHRHLERDSRAAKLAKGHHGYTCQACEMSFTETYGDIGAEFIEAHHLYPLSQLLEEEERVYAADDFAVLCSNCHRMIHRWPEPADLRGFREMLKKRRQT